MLSIAKTGFFTHGNHNAYDSVCLSNLYEVFAFLMAEQAQSDYEENLHEQINKGK